jgi:threonine dehydratase
MPMTEPLPSGQASAGPGAQGAAHASAPQGSTTQGSTARPKPTLLHEPAVLARRLGVRVILAIETFQFTGSFKFRAALCVAQNVPQRMILAASSGNFGQALACACTMTGKASVIVMPHNSARVKIDAVRSYGGFVELVDTRAKTRAARVNELREVYPDAYVSSAYDDPWVIAGNSSLGVELADRLPADCTHVVAPIGGGGLASGLIEGFRKSKRPLTILAAEPALANDAARSIREGRIVANEVEPQTIADGARTPSVGQLNWPILSGGLERIVEVPEEKIGEAVRLLFDDAHVKAEPTGALSLAAVLTAPELFQGKTVCCVVSGGNVDADVYANLLVGLTAAQP